MEYELTDKQVQEMSKRFTYHKPKDDQTQRYEKIRSKYLTVVFALYLNCPESKELSLALTKLEESVFWANEAITRNEVFLTDAALERK